MDQTAGEIVADEMEAADAAGAAVEKVAIVIVSGTEAAVDIEADLEKGKGVRDQKNALRAVPRWIEVVIETVLLVVAEMSRQGHVGAAVIGRRVSVNDETATVQMTEADLTMWMGRVTVTGVYHDGQRQRIEMMKRRSHQRPRGDIEVEATIETSMKQSTKHRPKCPKPILTKTVRTTFEGTGMEVEPTVKAINLVLDNTTDSVLPNQFIN